MSRTPTNLSDEEPSCLNIYCSDRLFRTCHGNNIISFPVYKTLTFGIHTNPSTEISSSV